MLDSSVRWPYALLSLLEIMERFHPESFSTLASLLGFSTSSRVPIEEKNRIFSRARSAEALPDEVTESFRFGVLAVVQRFEDSCAQLGLRGSAVTTRKLVRLLSNPPVVRDRLAELAEELQGRLHDEMSETVFFSLTPKEAAMYSRPLDGWGPIVARFPDTVNDIEEMNKSLAVSRYAAAVFHAVHVVENGLIELGKFIGVADPLSGWTAVSSRLDQIVKLKHNDRSQFEKDHFPFLEQISATVAALKNAWRNKISHAQGKLVVLTTDFTPEVAEEIVMATRSFMRRLVDGLPT